MKIFGDDSHKANLYSQINYLPFATMKTSGFPTYWPYRWLPHCLIKQNHNLWTESSTIKIHLSEKPALYIFMVPSIFIIKATETSYLTNKWLQTEETPVHRADTSTEGRRPLPGQHRHRIYFTPDPWQDRVRLSRGETRPGTTGLFFLIVIVIVVSLLLSVYCYNWGRMTVRE